MHKQYTQYGKYLVIQTHHPRYVHFSFSRCVVHVENVSEMTEIFRELFVDDYGREQEVSNENLNSSVRDSSRLSVWTVSVVSSFDRYHAPSEILQGKSIK
jgi:hypothetical protein